MNEHAHRRRRSPPAYTGGAQHYETSQPQHYYEPMQQQLSPLENSTRQQSPQFNRMPFNEAPEQGNKKTSSYSPTFADSVLIKHSTEIDDDYAIKNQKRLRANMIVLHNLITRDYHMHNLAQAYFGTTHLLLFYVPSSLLTLGGGILSLMYFAYDEDEDTQDLRDLLVTLFIFVAALLQGLSNYFSISSRSIQHRHTAGELRKLSNRLQNHYFSADLTTTTTLRADRSEGKKLTIHEMVKYQQLYDQVIRSCHSDLPRSFPPTFNYMDVRIEALLGSMYDDNIEARGWLMPLVYQALASAIREAFLWPLVTWNSPRWYTERALNSLVKPSSLLNELDDSDGETKEPHRRRILFCFKKREQGDKLRNLVRGNAAREAMFAARDQNLSDESIERGFDDEYGYGVEEKMEEGEIIQHNPEGMALPAKMIASDPLSHDNKPSPTTHNYEEREYDPSLIPSNPTLDQHDRPDRYGASPPIYSTKSMEKSDGSVNEKNFIFDDDNSSSVENDIQNLSHRDTDGDNSSAVSRTMVDATRGMKALELEEKERENSIAAVDRGSLENEKMVEAKDIIDSKQDKSTENLSYSSSSPSTDFDIAPDIAASNVTSLLLRSQDWPIDDDDGDENSSVSQAAKDDVARIVAEAEAEAAEEATQKYSQSSLASDGDDSSVGSEGSAHLSASSEDKEKEAAIMDPTAEVRIADKEGTVMFHGEAITKNIPEKRSLREMAEIEAERRATEEETARLIAEAIAMKAAKDAAENEAARKKAEKEAAERAAEEEAERLRVEAEEAARRAAEEEAERLRVEVEEAARRAAEEEAERLRVEAEEAEREEARLKAEEEAAKRAAEEEAERLRVEAEAAEKEAARRSTEEEMLGGETGKQFTTLKYEEDEASDWSEEGIDSVRSEGDAESGWSEGDIESLRSVEEATRKVAEMEAAKLILKAEEQAARMRAVAAAMEAEEIEAAKFNAEKKITDREAEEVANLKRVKGESTNREVEQEIAIVNNEPKSQKVVSLAPSARKTSFAKGTKAGQSVSRVKLLVQQLEDDPKRSLSVLARNNGNDNANAEGLSRANSMSGLAAGMLLNSISGEGASHSSSIESNSFSFYGDNMSLS